MSYYILYDKVNMILLTCIYKPIYEFSSIKTNQNHEILITSIHMIGILCNSIGTLSQFHIKHVRKTN